VWPLIAFAYVCCPLYNSQGQPPQRMAILCAKLRQTWLIRSCRGTQTERTADLREEHLFALDCRIAKQQCRFMALFLGRSLVGHNQSIVLQPLPISSRLSRRISTLAPFASHLMDCHLQSKVPCTSSILITLINSIFSTFEHIIVAPFRRQIEKSAF